MTDEQFFSHYLHQASIKSYDDAKALFRRAKNKDNGKPIRSWMRLFKEGDNFVLKHDGVPVLTITPDNIATFPLTVNQGKSISNTLSSSLYRVVPFMWSRLGKNRYGIAHTKKLDEFINKSNTRWYWATYMRTDAPELFKGLQFNLLTGECLNPQPKPNGAVNGDAKIEWLRALRSFKRGVQTRAKIGVLDSLCQQVVEERNKARDTWQQPDWTHERWTELLYTCVRDNVYPTDLLKGFVMSSKVSYWRHESPTAKSTLQAMDSVLDDMSIELRRRFGVFDA